jgi:hypothetical protein
MASDLWNIVKTKEIYAKIYIGNVEEDISSILEAIMLG